MSWRDLMPVHPAADAFPMLDDAELVALGDDIRANGLANPIAVECDIVTGRPTLVDGRNRLAAMERVGIRVQLKESPVRGAASRDTALSPPTTVLIFAATGTRRLRLLAATLSNISLAPTFIAVT